MKRETELKVQAWLDGELPAAEAAEIRRGAETEPALTRLAAELRFARSCFAGGELSRSVPEPREFYWSQIERQIHRTEPSVAVNALPLPRPWAAWLRWLAPAAIVAVLALLLISPEHPVGQHKHVRASEVDTPLDDLGSFTFHSDAEQINVVWVGSF